MRKLSLATIVVLSTVGALSLAQAETHQPVAGVQEGSQPMTNQNVNTQQEATQGVGLSKPRDRDRPHNRADRQPMDGRGYGMGQTMGRGHKQGVGGCPYATGGQFSGGYRGQGVGSFMNGGFMPSQHPSNVADAANWHDDQPVVLEGKISRQVGRKDFVFQDASGELTLEIDARAWHGQSITPNDQVRIVAGVEKSWGKTEVFGLYVEKMSSQPHP